MAVLSTLNPSQKKWLGGVGLAAVLYTAYKRMNAGSKRDKKQSGEPGVAVVKRGNKRERISVDRVFFSRLMRLLKVLVPRFFCAEVGYAALVAVAMIARTYCDVWMLKIGTVIERTIITRDGAGLKKYLMIFLTAMLPISIVNNLLKYGLGELTLRFRTRLTNHLYKEYLNGFTYYKIGNLDSRISNPDQLLTQDVDKFCNSISDLYSNLSKPLLDILVYARKLTGSIGAQGPLTMMGYLAVSGVLLTNLRAPIGRFTVNEQRLEGDFRFVNSRLITHSEEVAFYNGNEREREVIQASFRRLVSHLRKSMQFRYSMGVVDNIIAKYFATVVGYWVVSRPFVDLSNPRFDNTTHTERMEDYYRSGRMLMNLATAVGRLVLAGRELTRLAGFTARMTELMDVLKDLNEGKYQRTMVTDDANSASAQGLAPNAGNIVLKDHTIKFDKVPLVTPNGDVLVRALSFAVSSGMNVLVAGPNGCGKSSLFRILGELWPVFGGTVTKPAQSKLFYIPQRPYLALGTLRDQVIYPHTVKEYRTSGMTDDKLRPYLEQVHLGYLVDREGGWDSVQDWADVLSGGEKQRVAMARLFYHKPQFAILDECTSAVSVDVEGFMYNHSRELGVALFTVSHRKSLWKYHEYVLQFDGRGSYEFKRIDQNSDQFGS